MTQARRDRFHTLRGWLAHWALGLAFLPIVIGQAEAAEDPWLAYVGTHFEPAPWAGFVRGAARGKTGMALLQNARDPAAVDAVLTDLAREVRKYIDRYDVIVPIGILRPGGGARRGSDRSSTMSERLADFKGRIHEFMSFVERDQGRAWKDLIRRQGVRLARLPGGGSRVFWQVGNEIDSVQYAYSLRTWAGREVPDLSSFERRRPGGGGARDGAGQQSEGQRSGQRSGQRGDRGDRPGSPVSMLRSDTSIIPEYAEYFLAPTVEALDEASTQVFGAPGNIHVVLGSLARTRSRAARDWLDELLRYQVRGDFAPRLAGKRVNELVDVVAIHYLVGHPGERWRSTLDELKSKWLGTGRITGIWSTEEVGYGPASRGRGAASALRVTFRYLDWCLANSFGPHQCRATMWGSNIGPEGTRVGEGMRTLFEFLGARSLVRLAPGAVRLSDQQFETYGFESRDQDRYVIAAFSRDRGEARAITEIVLRTAPGVSGASATAHVFSRNGRTEARMTVTRRGDALVLKPATAISVDGAAAALILVHSRP